MYRYYDQAELDRQYNARGTVPDIGPIIAEYARRTREAQSRTQCVTGISYGPSEPERLDIYLARSSGPAPVWIFIHGGYWRLLDAADSGFMAETFTAAGICVVALNYALAPAVSLDEIVRQCRAALAWVYENIHRYGGDRDRIHVAGSSAGAHLAAMLCAAAWAPSFGLPEGVVKGATLLSGLYDLEPLLLTHPNEWLKLDRAAALRNSPIRMLPPPGLPMVFSYAPNETDEFKRQSEVYMAACQAVGCNCQFVAAPGTNHFDIVFELCRKDSALTQAVWQTIWPGPR